MKHLGTKRLETNRLVLRKFSLADAEAMFKYWASDSNVTRYLTWLPHESVDVTKSIIQSWVDSYNKLDHYQWAIELKTLGKPIGSISVVSINPETETVEIGYCISSSYWRQGITSEALSQLLEFFFKHVKVEKVQAKHHIDNPNSGKVMIKCGLKKEGIQKKSTKSNTGELTDCVLYSISSSDYLS